MADHQDRPAVTEIEISLFGRGFGEAMVLHLGDGRWMIIDSLVEETDEPVALRYLRDIGVNAEEAVELIVASHWHDDHVEGLAQVYAECPGALMVLPGAMNSHEMDALRAEAGRYTTERVSSGVRELNEIARVRSIDHRPEFRFGKINTRLLRIESGESSHGCVVEVEAISPSDADVAAFLREVARRPPPSSEQRWVMPFDENDVSIALWLSVGGHRMLLGADLKRHRDEQRGWGAVLRSPAPVNGQAGVYKVAHHGAINAHHDQIWSTLLMETPIAALTTWNRGHKLPRPNDVTRILELTSRSYITSGLGRRSRARPKMVENKVRERGAEIRGAGSRAGQIRLRLDLVRAAAEWQVMLFDGAMLLQQLRLAD
jgi:beta-lactamase superfamily II metal-dependent hydrolase